MRVQYWLFKVKRTFQERSYLYDMILSNLFYSFKDLLLINFSRANKCPTLFIRMNMRMCIC
jgi:hypothetical protein